MTLAALLAAAPAFAADPEEAMGVERGKFGDPDALVTVEFENFSWKLTNPMRDALRSFAASADKGSSFEVGGYADAVGPEDANQALSEKRARNVRAYLIRRGFSESQLTAVGYGESQPVDTNETEEGRANNRRVVVRPAR